MNEFLESESKRPAPERAQATTIHFSDCEGRAAGAVAVLEAEGKDPWLRTAVKGSGRGVKSHGQSGKLRRDQRRRLRGKPAERALVVAVPGGGQRSALAVNIDAKRSRVPERRLEVGGDLGCFGLRELGRSQRLMVGNNR